METDRRTVLLAIAFGLAGLTAVFHFLLGLFGIVQYVQTGSTTILPFAFLVGALLVYGFGVAYARGTITPPTAYLLGAGLMIAHVVAYADWHVFQVAENLLGLDEMGLGHEHGNGHDHGGHDHNGHDDHSHNGDDHDGNGHDHNGHDHDGAAHEVFIDHLRSDINALTTKVAETVSAIAFVALSVLER